jgi:FXSXX-COOH protein
MSSADGDRDPTLDPSYRANERVEPMPLVDLSGVPLTELRTVDRPELASSLERLIQEAMDPGGVTSGFNAVV